MVATVTQLRSSAQAVSYYEKDGYYAKDDPEHRDASFWHGQAARDAGLRGHVLPDEFEDVLAGWVPGTETRLGRLREGEHDHRPGWDITFSAPKSVSLEGLVIGDRRAIRAHDDAVRATLGWIETDLLQTRGWDPVTRQRPRVAADGMIVAGFRHLASRNGDPQLHTHCVLANMTRNAAGEWRSVEPTKLLRGRKLIGAYYRNELARRLQSLGMAVTPTMVGEVPGFELAGYDKSFLDAFSGRRAEILAYLKEHDLPYNARNAQMAALRTRRAKKEIGLSQLVPQWRARARGLGLARDKAVLRPARPLDPATGRQIPPIEVPPPDLPENELRSLRRAPKLPPLPRDRELAQLGKTHAPPGETAAELSRVSETGVLEAVARAVDHVSERRTWVAEAEIRAVALGHAPGRYTLDEVDAAIGKLAASGALIEVERKGMDRAFVTERAVKAEKRILAFMRQGRGKGKALGRPEAVEERLAESRLTRGQKEAVRTVLLSDDLIVGVQGHAGSGKTTMLREVKDLLGDRPIHGLAPSAAAARVLGREAGIGATTLQWFLTRFGDPAAAGGPDPARAAYRGAVLAVDECSMIDTERMRELLRIANDLGVARIALVGDTAQLRAVDAGQPFRLLQKAGMRTATMDEVMRQEDEELREAVLRARHGEPGDSIRGLREDRVREVPRDDLGAEAARCWLALTAEERADTAVMAPTHEIRRQTNMAIRGGLAEEGTLHGRTLEIDRLVNRRLTRALAADIASYEPGDTVVFHGNAYGCRANDVCTVTAKRDGRVILLHPDGGERGFRPAGNAKNYLGLFDTERIALRAGDRIRWTRNRKAPRRGLAQPDLVNGGEAEIVGIGRKRVTFRDGDREFSLSRADPQLRHLDHAYCTTVHAAQGRTATGAIAILDAGGATDQAMFHVEISRVRREFLLLTDDREALIELLEARADSGDGALEALGIDPGTWSPGTSPGQAGTGPTAIPSEDAEAFATLDRDWRALRGQAGETGTLPFFLPGYRDTMARAAALAAAGDLTGDLQRLTDRMLAEHRRHLAHDREVRGLVGGIQDHWRRWPELGWAAEAQGCAVDELAEHAAWRAEGEELADAGRRRIAAQGDEGRHLAAMPAGGLAEALAGLERACLRDDARRFQRLWGGLRERAEAAGIPELLADGHAEVAALGERLAAAGGLDARTREAVAEWREVQAEQNAMAETVDTLPARVAAWQDRRAEIPPDGRAEAGPARDAWRRDGRELAALADGMSSPDNAHAPWLDAQPGTRAGIERVAEAVRETLRDDAWERFASAAEAIDRQWEDTGIEPPYLPRYPDMIAEARTLDGHAALPDEQREAVDYWLRYDGEAARLCAEIRDWPGRAEALLAGMPPPAADLDALTEWRENAEPLRGEARALRAPGGAHARHLNHMPPEAKALAGVAGRLDAAVAQIAHAELGRLMKTEREFAERTGGIRYDARAHGALMDRVRALDAEPELPAKVRDTVDTLLRYDERVGRDRERVGAFLGTSAGAADARRDLDAQAAMRSVPIEQMPGWNGWREKAGSAADAAKTLIETVPRPELAAHLAFFGAAPDDAEKKQREIRAQIARDERARAAAEAERRAAAEARAAEENRRATERASAAQRQAGEREKAAGRDRARDRAAPVANQAARQPSRAEREAGRLAGRLDACMERRDRVLERACDRLEFYRPVAALGREHAGLRRQTGRALQAGRALLGDARYAPFLDGLGGRAWIEAAVDRLEKAALIDGLPARIAARWEKLEDRVRETGGHRYFLPEHGRLCRDMFDMSSFVKDKAAWRFMGGERDMRERMDAEAERLGEAAGGLRDRAAERARAEARGESFVRHPDYPVWRAGAERAVARATEILADRRTYAPHFEHDPDLPKTLETLSAELGGALRRDGAEWERVRSERAEAQTRERRHDISRGRGFSM